MINRYIFDATTIYQIMDVEGITYTSLNIFEGTEEEFLNAFPNLETALQEYKNSLIGTVKY